MRRMLKCLLAALWIAMALMLPAAQAEDGTAWMDEPCPVGEGGFHFFEWEDIQKEDCTHGAITVISCRYCGKSHTANDPAPGHQWDEGKVTKEATCTEAGERTYTCTRLITNVWCGATRTESIPALGHDPETIPGKAATCTESGLTDGSRCKRCGQTLKAQETIPALGHDPETVSGKAATCTENGLTDGSRCRRCGQTLKAQETVAAPGHDWDEGTVTKEPTATEEGVRTYTCRRNPAHTRTEAIPKKPAPPAADPAPDPAPAPSHEHAWGEKKVEKPGSCVQQTMYRITCTGCGETKYEYGGYGDHDWGEWHTVTAPTATAPGKEERVCNLDSSHREEREIPATGEPEAAGTVIVTKIAGDTRMPLAGAHLRIDGPDVADEWISTTDPHTVEGLVINEVYTLVEVEAPEGYKTADSITFKVTGTDPLPLTMVDGKEGGLQPGLFLVSTWAPDAGAGKRYLGAIVDVDHTLTNTGNCDVYLQYLEGLGDSLDAPHPVGDGAIPGQHRLAPGESLTIHNYHRMVEPRDVALGVLYRSGYLNAYSARYVDEDGKIKSFYSNDLKEEVPLTYPEGEEPEEKKPQLTLTFLYDSPAKDVYDPEDAVYAEYTMVNTGNVPLKVVAHFTSDGVTDYDTDRGIFDPGEKDTGGKGWWKIRSGITPGTETEDLLGTVTIHFYYKGLDPNTGEELCRTETVTRTWKVGKPGDGPGEWEVPDESALDAERSVFPGFESADPAGYQLGEYWCAMLSVQNTGKVTIPAGGITVYDPGNGYTGTFFFEDIKPGERNNAFLNWYGRITEDDVKRGYIYLPPAEFTWTGPDSGKPRTVYSNALTLNVISKTGLLLRKGIAHVPENGIYFHEGEAIPWTLTVMNNSNEPITNVTVTDQGAVVGTFAEIKPGETMTCTVPPHTVTEYEATAAGSVSNIAEAVGTDLKGAVHTYSSNSVSVPTNRFSKVPLPSAGDPENGKKDEPDAGRQQPAGSPETPSTAGTPGGGEDPLGAVCGVNVGATVYKTTAHGPRNYEYYEPGETVDYTITVKNTGEIPIENLTLFDSLGGLAPIDTWPSLAPNEEHTFTFQWTVNDGNIADGYVLNQATLTYTFLDVSGTPMTSNPVYVLAGKNGHLPGENVPGTDGSIPGTDGSIPGSLHFPGLTPGTEGGGPTGCALEIVSRNDSELHYTLHTCSEHQAAADQAKGLGDAEAAALWRGEIDKLYETLYEAGDDEARAAVMNDRIAYWAYIDVWTALYHDDAALAELLRLRCTELCCMIHTAPAELPDSLTNNAASILNPEVSEICSRTVNGETGEVILRFDSTHSTALSDTIRLLSAHPEYTAGSALKQSLSYWSATLDRLVNAVYKASDSEDRTRIAAWRQGLDTMIRARSSFLNLLYGENEKAAAEGVLNLCRDALTDICEHKQ